jgi:hypothetical protein
VTAVTPGALARNAGGTPRAAHIPPGASRECKIVPRSRALSCSVPKRPMIPKPIEIWRSAKQSETLSRLPFLQEPRWRRWLGLARGGRRDDPALRIHHALAPFRQRGEIEGATAVVMAVARREPRVDAVGIESLLVDLRYCADEERTAYERLTPPARRACRPLPCCRAQQQPARSPGQAPAGRAQRAASERRPRRQAKRCGAYARTR